MSNRGSVENNIERDLIALFGEEAVKLGLEKLPYLHDSTEMQGLSGRADAVVLPEALDQICQLVAWCYSRGVPIIPRGGGTGFAGGAVPIDGGVVCSLERLNRILDFSPEFWRMQVEAGVTTGRVQRVARENGLYYPPDPGAAELSQIGGNLACNAGGPHSFKYGTTASWVTGIQMVIRAGDVVTFGGPVRKDVAGYDLRSLFIGSEGTLGIITGAWLRLIPAPEASHTVIAGYRDFRSGVAGLGRVLAYGLTPATLEYFDEGCVGATRRAFPGGLSDDVNFLVLSETDGSAGEADRISDQLMDALKQDAVFLSRTHDPRATAALTRWRSGVSFAVSAQRGGKMSEDIVVPFDKLAAAIQMLGDLEAQFHLPSCSWGHAGDGNLHATFMVDAASPEEITRAELATEALFARALEMHGSVSGEHGLGWVKRSQFHRQFGPAEASLLTGIKLLFDPDNIFNPGKKVILPHE